MRKTWGARSPATYCRACTILETGARTATYKLATLTALIDHCVEHLPADLDAPLWVPLPDLAHRVIEVYWRQVLPFEGNELRQSTQPVARVLRAVMELRLAAGFASGGGSLDLAMIRVPAAYAAAVAEVGTTLVRQPLHRLQKLPGQAQGRTFLYDDSWMHDAVSRRVIAEHGDAIVLHPGVAAGLARLSGLLKPTLEILWVEDVRRMNRFLDSDVPDVAGHLFGRERVSLAAAREGLKDAFGPRCFYCAARLPADSPLWAGRGRTTYLDLSAPPEWLRAGAGRKRTSARVGHPALRAGPCPQGQDQPWCGGCPRHLGGSMPKSRGRHHRKANRSTRRVRPQRDAATIDAFAEFRLLAATDAAEARGDAEGALEIIEKDLARRRGPDYWRPERLMRLAQLSMLGCMLPGWATSRWILAQAAQTLDETSRLRTRRAFEIAFATGSPEAVPARDDFDRRVKTMDRDWVFRQALLYEQGGLDHFVRNVASHDLLVAADRIDDWAHAPMGAYRLVREEPQTLRWLDVGTGEDVETLNIGAACLLAPGDCVLGRLVSIESGSMFESAPLPVPEDLALRVADAPADWVAAVSTACRTDEGDDLRKLIAINDFRLLTDVPTVLQTAVAWDVAQRSQPSPQPETFSDRRALHVGLVRAALDQRLGDGPEGLSCAPAVAAALLEPVVFSGLWATLRTVDAENLRRLAATLAGPAADLCRLLAVDLQATA